MPEAFAEILAYDCRLMNVAAASGGALTLRQWLVHSDEWLSPQAAVLSPAAVIEVAEAIVGADSHYHATIAAGRAGVSILRRGVASGSLNVGRKELVWLDRIETELVSLPEAEAELLQEMRQLHADRFDPLSYGLNSDSEGIRARINRKK